MFMIHDLTTPPWENIPEGVSYLVCQHERGEKTEHDHLQGYVELTRAQDMNWFHSHIHPKAQCKKRYGTQAQAIAYCSKEETRIAGPWIFGEPYSFGQGPTSAVVKMRDMIFDGANMRTLIAEMPITLARHLTFARLCFTYRKPEQRTVRVFLLYGKTRVGKSRWVNDLYDADDLYISPYMEKKSWFDGYDGEPNVLLDDFSGGMPRTQLLRLLDRYRFRVPNKGGFLWWNPVRIYITTNIHPRKWYRDWRDFEEHYDALRARITACYDFNLGATMESRLIDNTTFFNIDTFRYHSASILDMRKGTLVYRSVPSNSSSHLPYNPFSGYNDF